MTDDAATTLELIPAATFSHSDPWSGIAADLAAAQKEFDSIGKGRDVTVNMKAGGSYRYKYAELVDVLAAVRPKLNEKNIALLQPFKVSVNTVTVTTLLLHKTGQWISFDVDMVYDAEGGRMNRNQAIASAITYARRYGLMAMTGVAASDDDDDDGAGSESTEVTPARADGATTVKSVTPYQKPGASWTRWDVVFADGRKAATFSKSMADDATACKAGNKLVIPEVKETEKGIDLIALHLPETAEAEPADADAPKPETILSTRPVKGEGGKDWWVVQGSEREYVTDDADLHQRLRALAASKLPIILTYDKSPGRRQNSVVRKIKTFTPVVEPTDTK